MGITKTDFMRGMQCRKMLWLDKHKPKLKVIPPEIQAKLDAGNEFGDRAMAMFGDYEEMTIYRPGTTIPDKKAMVAKTKEHLDLGTAVICEAAFMNYNNYCALDILRKTEDGYDIYEVKNAPEVREQFVKDVGFQYYIVNRCGVKVGKIFIVTHGEEDEFVINEVTNQAKEYAKWVNENIWDLNRMQKEAEEIEVEVGDQCENPYECWYYGYCHGDQYTSQAKARWGDTAEYWEYEKKKLSKEEEQDYAAQMMSIFSEFGEIRNTDPAGEQAQNLVRKLQTFITDHYFTCSDEVLSGLGMMYAGGGEFTKNIDKAGGDGTAEFVSKAIEICIPPRGVII